MKSLIYICDKSSELVQILKKICKSKNIRFVAIILNDEMPEITISPEKLIVSGQEVNADTIIFCDRIVPYFLVPPILEPSSFSSFNIEQIKYEQRLSHIMSFLEMAKEIATVINNTFSLFDNYFKFNIFEKLKTYDFNMPEFILTNSIDELKKSNLWSTNQIFHWSFPSMDSPLKKILKAQIPDLLNSKNSLPYLIQQYYEGENYKVWLYKDSVLLSGYFTKYNESEYHESIEEFNFETENEHLNIFGNKIYEALNNEFIEIELVIIEENAVIRNISYLPDLNTLPKIATEYIIKKMMMLNFNELSFRLKKIDGNHKRENLFTKRLLANLFEFADA